MTALSIFQILPHHVVCEVVNHVSGSSRVLYNNVKKGTDKYYWLQKPLLWACHNFRVAVVSNYGYTCTMGIRRYAQFVRSMWSSPTQDIGQPDRSIFHLAKELVIELDMWSMCTDSTLEFLSREIYEDGVFPLVRSVKFVFDDFDADEDILAFLPSAQANAKAFVQRIHRMAPRASEVEMVTDVYSYNFHAYLSDLLAQLYHLATRVRHISGGSDIVHTHQMSLVCNLVHLSYEVGDGGGEVFVHLAQQSASTLQSLSMDSSHYEDIIGLIRNGNGDYVQYPQLLLLEHLVDSDTQPENLPVFSGAIPFPRLKSLSFRSRYPFGDDVSFRGNAATLQKLSLTLDHSIWGILHRHRVFTQASHPALRYVDIYLDEEDEPGHSANDWADLLRLSLSIGPCAPMRRIDYFKSEDTKWIHMLPTLGTHQNIQILELHKVRLTLYDSIVLIRSLPLLSDLHALAPRLGNVFACVDLGQLAASFSSKQLPTDLRPDLLCGFFTAVSGLWGEKFRFWRITEMRPEKLGEAVHCMLLLALLCPNFDYAASGYEHWLFMDRLGEAIDADAFKPYATRLRRLLFTM